MEVYCITASRLGSLLASSNGREFIESLLGEASRMFVHSSSRHLLMATVGDNILYGLLV